jgi:hypothetical protein
MLAYSIRKWLSIPLVVNLEPPYKITRIIRERLIKRFTSD